MYTIQLNNIIIIFVYFNIYDISVKEYIHVLETIQLTSLVMTGACNKGHGSLASSNSRSM